MKPAQSTLQTAAPSPTKDPWHRRRQPRYVFPVITDALSAEVRERDKERESVAEGVTASLALSLSLSLSLARSCSPYHVEPH